MNYEKVFQRESPPMYTAMYGLPMTLQQPRNIHPLAVKLFLRQSRTYLGLDQKKAISI